MRGENEKVNDSELYRQAVGYLNELSLTIRATKTQVLSDRDRNDALGALGHLGVALARFDNGGGCNPECCSMHTYESGCQLHV